MVWLAVVHVSASCSSHDSGLSAHYERFDSLGVDVVVNSSADLPLNWTFREEFSIGGGADEPDALGRVRRESVRADAMGNLFVLDPMNHRVLVFGPEGGLIRQVGRRGGGPGEFQVPANMTLSPDGNVAVYDFAKRRLVWFDSSGEALPEQELPWAYRGPMLEVVRGGIVFSRAERAQEESSLVQYVSLAEDQQLYDLGPISLPIPSVVEFARCNVQLQLEEIFSPTVVWTPLPIRLSRSVYSLTTESTSMLGQIYDGSSGGVTHHVLLPARRPCEKWRTLR